MSVDKTVKQDVNKDWDSKIPQLSLYSQNKLYRIVGSVIMGIELINIPRSDDYRPHFVVYPLWGNDIKECFDAPIILKEYHNKKNLQFDIPYVKHSLFIDEVIESIKQKTPVIFEDNISIGLIMKILDDYSNESPLKASKNSYLQAKLIESMLKINLYSSDNTSDVILNKIKSIEWNSNNFKYFGFEVGSWIKKLEEIITNRVLFLEQIELNKKDKKIQKLKYSEVVF